MTINLPKMPGGVTRIGDQGYFMVGAHIAHDNVVGDQVMLVNAATLAGHVPADFETAPLALADLIGGNRSLLEDALFRVRELELTLGEGPEVVRLDAEGGPTPLRAQGQRGPR